jgi:hypothetical protein
MKMMFALRLGWLQAASFKLQALFVYGLLASFS